MLHIDSSDDLLVIKSKGLKDQTFGTQRYNSASTAVGDRNCHKHHLTDTECTRRISSLICKERRIIQIVFILTVTRRVPG